MADIHIEKREKSAGWLWAIVALAAVVLIGWWLWPRAEREIAEVAPLAPVEAPAAPAGTATSTETPTVGTVMANPQQWVGRQFSGTVEVTEVPTDRGFWIEQNGQRMFALVIDRPAEKPVDINAGQRIQIDNAMLHDAAYIPQLEGSPLTSSTESVVREQPIYLVVDESDMTILDRAA